MVFNNAYLNSKNFIIVILAGMTIFFRLRVDRLVDTSNIYSLSPPPPALKYYSFGFDEVVADSLWLRYVQDLEKCNTYGKKTDEKTPCSKGWSFQMLDQITDLAPKFRMPYAIGPISLSVLTDDYDGAGIIFEKGIKYFPHDWKIQYRAAYFYLYDKQDPMRAARLLLAAQKNGGPEWLALLATKLYDRSGQLALGISTLNAYKNQIQDPNIKKRVERRLSRLMCESDALKAGKTAASVGCAKESDD